MPAATIFLGGTGTNAVLLSGDLTAGVFTLSGLEVAGTNYTMDESVEIPEVLNGDALLTNDGSGTVYRFVRPNDDAVFAFRVGFSAEAGAASFSFLGQDFDTNLGMDAELEIRIGPRVGVDGSPCAIIRVRGVLQATSGGSALELESIWYEITINRLPEALDTGEIPSFRLGLPDLGFAWPRLRLPFSWPSFPDFPFRGGARNSADEEGGFPLRIGWEQIGIDTDEVSGEKILKIELLGFFIAGAGEALIEADLTIALDREGLRTDECKIEFHCPEFARRLSTAIEDFAFEDDCLAVKLTETPLNSLLASFGSEIGLGSGADEVLPVVVHVGTAGGGIESLRIDWLGTGGNTRWFGLFGFEVGVPAAQMFSFLIHRDEERGGGAALKALVTLAGRRVGGADHVWVGIDTGR